jgi:dTDP-4-amino-4,6-dideoxygalactose transaminase
MGIHQLAKLPSFLERRRYLADRYLAELADLPLILPAGAPKGDVHSWHLFVIRLRDDASVNRDELIQILADNKIGTSVHYVPLHRHPYWRNKYNLSNEDFPVSDSAYLAMLSIPLYTSMSDEQQNRVISVLQEALG